jgi:hypothetical protein
MNHCNVCGSNYSEQSCHACNDPAKYLTLDQIEDLAEKYGDASTFALALRVSAARTLGRRTSLAKADSSRNNGRLGGRPRKKR